MPRPDFPKTILEFQRRFSTEQACRDYLFWSRWPDGFVCPRCGGKDAHWISTRPLIRCRLCNYQASLTAGTVMQDTRTHLTMWFWAAFLVATHTPGFSALQFQRYAGMKNYKVAFNMLHKLRAAMVRPDRDMVHGLVQVDETYIGGPKEGKRGRGAAGKVLVVAALEILGESETDKRVGRLRMRIAADGSADSLIGFVEENVTPGSIVVTDDWSGYNGLGNSGYAHEVVDPKVLEHIHRTFGNLKTWLEGTHHGVSEKHLQAYLNEFVFRHNRRRTPMAAFQTTLGLATHTAGPTYQALYKGRWVHPNPWG